MKIAQLNAFGPPPEVVDCVETAEPGPPTTGEVLIEMLAGPINPAELLIMEGKYASKPDLPARLGIEGAGRVLAVGGDVDHVAPGDLVVSLDRTNWAQRHLVKAEQAVKAPAGIDVLQLSMVKINPATAYLMLKRYVDLAPGDWVIQNAANSAVGTCLVRLAKAWGLKTVNVVRRDSALAALKEHGADVALVDGDDLAERVAAETGGADIRLAIDAIAGEATLRLAACLAEGGKVVNYGLLSGQPCMLWPDQAIFRSIDLTGFWLARIMRETPFAELQAMYDEIMARILDGSLQIAVEATYGLEDIKAALEHAGRGGRRGKILLTPNGAVT